jgi:hypothetical protein
MAQRENLEVQGRACTDDAAERRQQRHQHGRHGEPSLSLDADKFNRVSAYDGFGSHTGWSVLAAKKGPLALPLT